MTAARPVSVVLTCVGGALSVEVIRALKEQAELPVQVIGVDGNERAGGQHAVDVFYRVPWGTDPDYVERMLEICVREQVRVVIPGSDEEAEALAAARVDFQRLGVTCAVPAHETVQTLRHKGRLLRELEQASIEMASYAQIASAQELEAAARQLGYPARPFVVKPCTARGGRGAVLIDERCQPMAWLGDRRLPRMRLQNFAALMPPQGCQDPLLAMEYLPGEAYDVDVLAHGGELLCLSIRRRYNKAGIPFAGCVTERDERIERKTRAIVSHLRLDFCIDIDMAVSETGEPQVLEVNPRFSGSVVGSLGAGINYPLEAIRMALGRPVTERIGVPGIETWPEVRCRSVRQADARWLDASHSGRDPINGSTSSRCRRASG